MNENERRVIHYDVTLDVHDAVLNLFDKLHLDDIKRILSAPNADGTRFTDVEVEIKTDFIFQFFHYCLQDAELNQKPKYVRPKVN